MRTFGARLGSELDRQEPQGRSRGAGLFLKRMEEEAAGTPGGILGCSRQSLRGYLRGDHRPSDDFIQAAARVLGIRAAWLAYGEGERTEAEEDTKRALLKRSDLQAPFVAALNRIEEVCPLVALASPGVKVLIQNLWMRYAVTAAKQGPGGIGTPFSPEFIDTTAFDIGEMLTPPEQVNELGITFELGGIDNYLLSATQGLLNLLPQQHQTAARPPISSRSLDD